MKEVRIAEKMLLSVDEAVLLSGLSTDLLRVEIAKGNVDYVKVGKGGKVLVSRKSLEFAVDEMTRRRLELSSSSARQEYKDLKARKRA